MQIHHRPTKILILGRSGSGKTTYMLRYVENCKHDHIFIYDHKFEFATRLGVQTVFDIDDCARRVQEGHKFISWNGTEDYPGDSEGAFSFFCEWVFEVSKAIQKNCLFVGDEVNRFTGASDMGWEFGQLIEDGRLQGLDFIGTSHAANQIHNRLRLQLSEIVALKTIDPRPLQFLEENGFDPEEVKALPVGAFITKVIDDEHFEKGKLFTLTQKPPSDRAQIQTNNDSSRSEAEDESQETEPCAESSP
jgi:hypothetical protein